MVARYERRPARYDDSTNDQAGHAILWRTSAKPTVRAISVAGSRWMTSGKWAQAVRSSWPLVARPADHDQSAFQGVHALSPLILVYEACGVPKSIFDAVDALATNSNAPVLAIGNPDDP
jgi:hypothetical protein